MDGVSSFISPRLACAPSAITRRLIVLAATRLEAFFFESEVLDNHSTNDANPNRTSAQERELAKS